MAGAGLAANGDVQLGADSAYVVCQSTRTGFNPQDFVRALEFNPWTWPDLSIEDIPLWHRSGLRPGADIPTGRRLEFTVFVNKPDAASLQTVMANIANVCQPVLTPGVEQELAFQYGGTKYVLYGRFRELSVASTDLAGRFSFKLKVKFLATDPAIYEAAEQSTVLPTYSSSLSNWHTAPLTAISTVDTASSPPHIVIGGATKPRWRAVMLGRALNPVIMDANTKTFFWVAAPAGYALPDNIQLEVNSTAKTIVQNGVSDHAQYHAYPSQWLELDPAGSTTNRLIFCMNNTFPGSTTLPAGTTRTATLYWRRAWWVLPS